MQNKNNTPYALTPILQIRFVAILYNYQKKKKTFQVLHKLFAKLNYYYHYYCYYYYYNYYYTILYL